MSLAFPVRDLVNATFGTLRAGPEDVVCLGVSTDSRSVETGELFVALRGPSFDGHRFVRAAVARGASAVIVAQDGVAALPPKLLADDKVPVIVVRDTLVALGQVAFWHRLRCEARLVAITGSNGKTTTKEFLAAVLESAGSVLRTTGNHNNLVGVPQTLLQLEPHHDFAVIELGTNAPGEIARLADMTRPDVGLITNVSAAHTELLGDEDGVAREKGALYAALPKEGFAVVNLDDRRCVEQSQRTSAPRTTFGEAEASDIRVREYRFGDRKPLASGTLVVGGQDLRIDTLFVGFHQIRNAAAALAAAAALGLDPRKAALAIRQVAPPPHRMVYRELTGLNLIDDCYNANPASMRAALETLDRCRTLSGAKARSIAVLGDMLELGDRSRAEHRELGRRVAAQGIDVFVGVGEAMEVATQAALDAGAKAVAHLPDARCAAQAITRAARAGDWVLVKGSRGVALDRVVDALVKGAVY